MPGPIMVDWDFTYIDDTGASFLTCNYFSLLPQTSLLFSDFMEVDEKRKQYILTYFMYLDSRQ